MYKIITPTGETYTTEKPNFIRVHQSGVYLLCAREKAEGIAYHGTPYLFKDGAAYYEFDSGENMMASHDTEALVLELAADHEARLCSIELGV